MSCPPPDRVLSPNPAEELPPVPSEQLESPPAEETVPEVAPEPSVPEREGVVPPTARLRWERERRGRTVHRRDEPPTEAAGPAFSAPVVRSSLRLDQHQQPPTPERERPARRPVGERDPSEPR